MKKSLSSSLLILFFSLNLQASGANQLWSLDVVQPVPVDSSAIGIGSFLKVNSKPEILLGQLVRHDGSFHSLMTLNPEKSTIEYISASHFASPLSRAQNVLKLYQQQGETCTAYAIDDFILQSHIAGMAGNANLTSALADEEGRASLLADTISQYYLVLQHRFSIQGILKGYGQKFGFSCRKKVFSDLTVAREYLKTSLHSGLPVLVSFYVGQNMSEGPFKMEKVDQSTPSEDTQLWLPRKMGERNSGGHSVVAVGSFTMAGADYVVMLDSDWALPRVWDLNQALSDRTAIHEVEFYTCE